MIPTKEQLSALGRLDTCTVSNTIETFEVRLRNEGFADSRVKCQFPDRSPVTGYAVTGRIRSSHMPPAAHSYFDRTDWWNYILSIPAPRIVVMEDVDDRPGFGAFIGEVHANILKSLECLAYVTNGAVRDLSAVEKLDFQLFAGNPTVSHAFAHIVSFGIPVEVGGLLVEPGDLLHGDRHGVLSVPSSLVPEIPAVASRLLEAERRIVELCQSAEFSLPKLRAAVSGLG